MEKKIRNTRQKDRITVCIGEYADGHFTAEELIDALKAQGTPVARATVYRHLNAMEEDGLLRKYHLAEGAPACYQVVDEEAGCLEHFHLMCIVCGEIVHFEDEVLSRHFHVLAREGGMRIDGGKTVFYGKCANCARN